MTALPEILWAQRSSSTEAPKNYIHITISVPDIVLKDCKLEIQPKTIAFSGYSSSLKRQYNVELELYDEIIPDQCTELKNSMGIQLRLVKKELRQEYWPRLTKDARKVGFIKTDFDRWVDEDEQDQPPEEDSAFSGGMGGMPGMGDMSSMMGGAGGDFGGIDFSKLGGDMGGEDGDDGDDDDEDMPSLEGDDEKTDTATEVKDATEAKDTTESTSKAKIEEIS